LINFLFPDREEVEKYEQQEIEKIITQKMTSQPIPHKRHFSEKSTFQTLPPKTKCIFFRTKLLKLANEKKYEILIGPDPLIKSLENSQKLVFFSLWKI